MTYDFQGQAITDWSMYDLDFVVLCLDNKKLGYIVLTGLTKTTNGQDYFTSDIKAQFETDNKITHLIGYSNENINDYKYFFATIEKRGG